MDNLDVETIEQIHIMDSEDEIVSIPDTEPYTKV
jgi:hypothetical protein